MNKRLSTILATMTVALFVTICIAWIQMRPGGMDVVAENFGGPFTLTDQSGKQVTEADFKNKWRLIYFGFTYCPAICPMELAKMTQALNALGPDAKIIQPIFITVDPERDTVKGIKNYLTSFYPSFIGLTGTVEQIEEAKKSYKIYAAKVKDPSMTDYTIDHSSFIYLIDPQDNLLAVYKTGDKAPDMAADIKKRLHP